MSDFACEYRRVCAGDSDAPWAGWGPWGERLWREGMPLDECVLSMLGTGTGLWAVSGLRYRFRELEEPPTAQEITGSLLVLEREGRVRRNTRHRPYAWRLSGVA